MRPLGMMGSDSSPDRGRSRLGGQLKGSVKMIAFNKGRVWLVDRCHRSCVRTLGAAMGHNWEEGLGIYERACLLPMVKPERKPRLLYSLPVTVYRRTRWLRVEEEGSTRSQSDDQSYLGMACPSVPIAVEAPVRIAPKIYKIRRSFAPCEPLV